MGRREVYIFHHGDPYSAEFIPFRGDIPDIYAGIVEFTGVTGRLAVPAVNDFRFEPAGGAAQQNQ
jgi:hypothetical protein